MLRELLGSSERYDVRLLGTDISDDAVARASKGVYGAVEMGRGMPDPLRQRYFTVHGDRWQIRDEIRAMIREELDKRAS